MTGNERVREIDYAIERLDREAIGADDWRAQNLYRQVRRLQRERDELLGVCTHCHGSGRVWDSSGWCAQHQMSRSCPICS